MIFFICTCVIGSTASLFVRNHYMLARVTVVKVSQEGSQPMSTTNRGLTEKEIEVTVSIIEKLARKGEFSPRGSPIAQIVRHSCAVELRGMAKDVIDDLSTDPECPLQKTAKDTVYLTDVKSTNEFLESLGADRLWWLE